MKKVILTLFGLCFAITSVFAQGGTPQNAPWTPKYNYEKVMVMVAVVDIDGVSQHNENIGVASFIDGECRDTKLYAGDFGEYLAYVLSISGDNGKTITFRLWNEETGEEMELDSDFTYTFDEEGVGMDGNFVHITFTTPSLEKEIIGYGTDYNPETNANAHYYLIASPVTGNVAPAQVNGLIPATGGYDLFYFDQTGDDNHNEWITYKEGNGATDPNFTLQNGKGYLYANEAGTTLSFEGTTLSVTEAPVDLAYDPTARWAGWNLVGNPFAKTAYPDRAYYALQNGSDLSAEIANSTPVGAMEGIFVKAANAEDNSMTFTTTAPGAKRAALVMNVTRGRSLSDRAIVCFGGNEMLPKFQLRQNSTKVYIPVEGNDFAVVSAEAMGELPVNFRAETSGNYTLNFAAENVSFTYLHLIDNMTGANIDLLQTPFYSFDATTADYASRFRLQFATGNSADGDTFGFFNEAGNLTIFGIEGTATLQVMDINGRILSTDTFSGSYEKQLNVAAGIYMLRLVNGNDVKVQKIVVR
jgi:hypothetical protein